METNELKIYDGKELLEMKFPDRSDCVKDFIPPGVGIFGGTPYSGKDWILLDICSTVARGELLWDMKTEQGTVLYITGGKTLRDMQKLMKSIYADGIDNLYFADEAEKPVELLCDQIGNFIDKHSDTRLIVIDPMMGWTGYNAGDKMITTLEWLRKMKIFAEKRGVSILLVKNTRNKKAAADVDCSFVMEETVDAADYVMFFSSFGNYGSLIPRGTLTVAARGRKELNLKFNFDKESGRWIYADPLFGLEDF